MNNQTRNLNPTPQAIYAMGHWSARYASHGGGSMDFWDSLTASEQAFCQEQVSKIRIKTLHQLRTKLSLNRKKLPNRSEMVLWRDVVNEINGLMGEKG